MGISVIAGIRWVMPECGGFSPVLEIQTAEISAGIDGSIVVESYGDWNVPELVIFPDNEFKYWD